MDRHLFFDGSFHSLQTDAELILQQFTDRADAAIAKMIDVVSLKLRWVLAHLQYVRYDFIEVLRRKKRIRNSLSLRFAHLDVELQSANAREVELPRVKEHRLQQPVSGLHCRWVTRSHLAINLK